MHDLQGLKEAKSYEDSLLYLYRQHSVTRDKKEIHELHLKCNALLSWITHCLQIKQCT